VEAYQHSRSRVFLIQYQLVWCPKGRKLVLVGRLGRGLSRWFVRLQTSWGFKVLELAINSDHVHLLISAYPTIPVHKIVKRIKE
jgi:putative transposase